MIHFDLPKEQSSIIKVIGVGGGGSNAVNYMYSQGIEGVDFVICNTDAQALSVSKVPNKIQLGPNLTQGLGAGANPEIGRQACEESMEEVRRILEVNTKMVFITAGMGGGTGTGGAPIVARMSREMGILTVGIVTMPFSYEGKKRLLQAQEGVNQLKGYVDTLLVISNDKLRHQFGNLTMRAAFSTADNVLATAAKCITDVISSTGQINVDFADVCTVMRNGGVAILGNSRAEGENRAQVAIEQALNSPLLNDNDIRGARWILININSAEGESEFTMDEVEIIQQYLHSHAGPDRDVIMGLGYDNSLGRQIGITLIATGFEHKNPFDEPSEKEAPQEKRDEKIILKLDSTEAVKQESISNIDQREPDPGSLARLVHQLLGREDAAQTESRNDRGVRQPEQGILPFNATSLSLPSDSNHPAERQVPISDMQRPTDDLDKRKGTGEKRSQPLVGTILSKPSNIYAEEETPAQALDPNPLQESHKEATKEYDPNSDMQLVIKENEAADGPMATPTHILLASAEEPALQDETEEQKRKAAERLHKLRNLSYNINAADPNNEYEHVPAFIRRNFQDKQQSLSVPEQYYSNYTVKKEEGNQSHLSTINTFLEGEKPD